MRFYVCRPYACRFSLYIICMYLFVSYFILTILLKAAVWQLSAARSEFKTLVREGFVIFNTSAVCRFSEEVNLS